MNRNAKPLQQKAKTHNIRPVTGKGQWVVISGTSGAEYTVFALEHGGYSCTCTFGQTSVSARGLAVTSLR